MDLNELPVVYTKGDEDFIDEILQQADELNDAASNREEEEEEEEEEDEEDEEYKSPRIGARTARSQAAKNRLIRQESGGLDVENFVNESTGGSEDLDLQEFDIFDKTGEECKKYSFDVADYEKRVALRVYNMFVEAEKKEKSDQPQPPEPQKKKKKGKKKSWETAKAPMKNLFSD